MPSVCRRLRQNCLGQFRFQTMSTFQTLSTERLRNLVLQNELTGGVGGGESLVHDNSDGLLLLDCRPFLVYNQCHVKGAVNVHCPAILRRRSGGRLPLRTVIPSAEIRQKITDGRCHPLVLYDDQHYGQHPNYGRNNTTSISDENITSMALFVAKCLKSELNLKNIFVLEGGFPDFGTRFPTLCSETARSEITSYSSRWSPTSAYVTNHPRLSGSPVAGGGGYTSPQDCPVEILPHLFLGDAHHAACRGTLGRLGITALLNVSHTCPNHFEDSFTYKCIPVEDTGNEDIGAWFQEAITFIDDVKCSNGRVLVHCRAGISRSATICMAYLMATKRLRMEDAYEFVKLRRRIVSPNFSFMGQLLSFEAQLFGPAASAAPPSAGAISRSLSPLPAASPLLDPDPDALTPSRGAAHHQTVFDFPLCDSGAAASVGLLSGTIISPGAVTPGGSPKECCPPKSPPLIIMGAKGVTS